MVDGGKFRDGKNAPGAAGQRCDCFPAFTLNVRHNPDGMFDFPNFEMVSLSCANSFVFRSLSLVYSGFPSAGI